MGPVLIAAPVIALTWRRFPLTTLLCTLIAMHAVVLILGGTYTYARVPLGFRIQELLGLERNPYDRIGHVMQGFVPVMIARAILLRGAFVAGRRMLAFVAMCIALAFSAFYELIEWWAALALGAGRPTFSARRAIPGTRRPTCSARSPARSPRWCCCRRSTTARSAR